MLLKKDRLSCLEPIPNIGEKHPITSDRYFTPIKEAQDTSRIQANPSKSLTINEVVL